MDDPLETWMSPQHKDVGALRTASLQFAVRVFLLSVLTTSVFAFEISEIEPLAEQGHSLGPGAG